jgi:hypothetical protein
LGEEKDLAMLFSKIDTVCVWGERRRWNFGDAMGKRERAKKTIVAQQYFQYVIILLQPQSSKEYFNYLVSPALNEFQFDLCKYWMLIIRHLHLSLIGRVMLTHHCFEIDIIQYQPRGSYSKNMCSSPWKPKKGNLPQRQSVCDIHPFVGVDFFFFESGSRG